MDTIFKTKSQKALDDEIVRVLAKLSSMEPSDKEYVMVSDNLKVLCDARDKKDPSSISTETLLAIGANLIGLLIVLNFEKTGVITSKAFGWIWKTK